MLSRSDNVGCGINFESGFSFHMQPSLPFLLQMRLPLLSPLPTLFRTVPGGRGGEHECLMTVEKAISRYISRESKAGRQEREKVDLYTFFFFPLYYHKQESRRSKPTSSLSAVSPGRKCTYTHSHMTWADEKKARGGRRNTSLPSSTFLFFSPRPPPLYC